MVSRPRLLDAEEEFALGSVLDFAAADHRLQHLKHRLLRVALEMKVDGLGDLASERGAGRTAYLFDHVLNDGMLGDL